MSLLAIDIGTSRAKGIAFNASGAILAQHESSYSPNFPRPSFAELNAVAFWNALQDLCRAISEELGGDPVEALCICSHGETFICVDSKGDALAPAILNLDGRAAEESVWFAENFGTRELFRITGLVAHPMYPLPKIIWLRKHAPELFRGARFLPVISYLFERMALPPVIDYSLASRFLAFDILRRSWSAEIFGLAEISASQLPEAVAAGTPVGKLSTEIARQLGLTAGIPIVVGGHDQACAALGVGSIEAGRVSDSAGTYECLTVVTSQPQLGEAALVANLNSYCHVAPGVFLTLAFFPSGIMVDWFCDLIFGRCDIGTGASNLANESRYASLEEQAPAEPTGLCITPNLIGTCHPDFNPHARGVIWGIGPASNRAQIYKGILEGIAMEFAGITACLERVTGPFAEVYATGGGMRSRLGVRLRASLSGKQIQLLACPDAVCLGGAMLASVAAGTHANIATAARAMVQTGAVVAPDSKEAASYHEQFRRYHSLSSVTRDLGQRRSNRSKEKLQ